MAYISRLQTIHNISPHQRQRASRTRALRAPHPRGHKPGASLAAGDGRGGGLHAARAAQHPGAGGQLPGRHRAGVPHGVHYTGDHSVGVKQFVFLTLGCLSTRDVLCCQNNPFPPVLSYV